ncbi:MAG: efflux RND transporter periplasmic adaptor subunit [Candidatus Levyibacteriota bacterium]
MSIRMTRRRTAGALAVAVLIGGLAGTVALRASRHASDEAAAAAGKAAPVALEFAASDLTHPTDMALGRWLPVSGTLEPVRQAVVKAKVAGDVVDLALREGDPVRAGQRLARIESADLSSRLADRMGALESARAQLALADKTRSMNLRLLHDRFISQSAFDNTESSFDVARGNVKSAEAQVQLARNALRDTDVVAPLSGIVARRQVQPGEKVAVEAPLLTIVDLDDLEVQAMVPAIDVPEVQPGMPVELSVDGFRERRFAGRVERINPSTEPGTRAIIVHVGLHNPDAALRAGMFATGRIALAAGAPVPTLPTSAVRSEAGQSWVWTIESGRLVRHVVVTGRRDEEAGRVEIRTPLPPQAPVLAGRFDNLKEGGAAIVRTARSGDAAPAGATPAGGAVGASSGTGREAPRG